jgi:ubiquinone/menaquinone biosynthesis C-methylase UbiE
MEPSEDGLWNGERGAGGISWADRSRMGPLRGVIDAADSTGRRNLYMHALHLRVLKRELARTASVKRALDFGCGTGRFINTLSRYCADVMAVDKEPAMVAAAKAYAPAGTRIEVCRPTKVPAPAAAFDFVLCSSVLCVTVSELLEAIVNELARVTRPGGTLMLLEQVSEARRLQVSRYYDALRKARFQLVRAYPIRSAGSKFTSLVAANPSIPTRAFDGMAAIELFFTARLPMRRAVPYVEYAMLARRRAC